jgi:hypothetical protein
MDGRHTMSGVGLIWRGGICAGWSYLVGRKSAMSPTSKVRKEILGDAAAMAPIAALGVVAMAVAAEEEDGGVAGVMCMCEEEREADIADDVAEGITSVNSLIVSICQHNTTDRKRVNMRDNKVQFQTYITVHIYRTLSNSGICKEPNCNIMTDTLHDTYILSSQYYNLCTYSTS